MKKAKVFEQLTAVQVEAIKTALRSGRHITHSQVGARQSSEKGLQKFKRFFKPCPGVDENRRACLYTVAYDMEEPASGNVIKQSAPAADEVEPWKAEGISKATYYRRKRETTGDGRCRAKCRISSLTISAKDQQ